MVGAPRRIAALFSAAAAALLCFGCGDGSGPGDGGEPSGRPQVVATILPVYALTLDVAGNRGGVEISLLMPAGAGCPHDYSLSPGDLARLARADVVLANGAGLEPFLDGDALARVNPRAKLVDLSAGLDLLPRRGAAVHEDDDEGHQDHEGAYNGHVYASPRNAAAMVRVIGAELAALDPEGADAYRANAERTAGELLALADEFAAAGRSFPNRRVVAMHDIFDYLARDAGLEVVAVVEEEPGQEPGLGVFAELVRTVRETKPAVILTEPQYSDQPARALSRETGVPLLCLDPFAAGRAEPGAYLATMRGNLELLKKVLGAKAGGSSP